MGIRVDEKSLEEQLKKAGCEERKNLPYHKMLLNGELPYTIGGGIGQSRLCMLLIGTAHIGEVHSSMWDDETVGKCEKAGIMLENAKKTIEVERQQTMNTLQSEIAGLAMQAARKIVDEETRKQGNQAIYDQFLESVGDAHDGKDE